MKKILITGRTGFIRSHVCELFLKKGFRVKTIIKYNDNSDLGWVNHLKENSNFSFSFGDILDYPYLERTSKGFDYIIHLDKKNKHDLNFLLIIHFVLIIFMIFCT
jgi:nucleoside-diphosphate-sugar epimerase